MKSTAIKELKDLVVHELLPVYLKYHQQHNLPVPTRVVNSEALREATYQKPIPALLKPIKNSC